MFLVSDPSMLRVLSIVVVLFFGTTKKLTQFSNVGRGLS